MSETDDLLRQVEHWKGNAASINAVLTKTVEKLAVAELQVSEARNEAMLLHCDNQDLRKEVERLKKFLPHDGKPCYGPDCHHCDEDEEAKTGKRDLPTATVEHCHGAHCYIYGMKACICLCAKCADAKIKDR